jgi:pyruvate formate lyase activating enzyme
MEKTAAFSTALQDTKVQCMLCAHHCSIGEGKTGICGVRKNKNGHLVSLIYGTCSSITPDPIEKKPLYHFHPGTRVFSLGTIGCNFRCSHCQNYSISTADMSYPYLKEVSPEEAVELAEHQGCQGMAWTYNEPTIWHEFSFDCAKLAKQHDLYTVYVTNGYIEENPLRELSPVLDAMNVDVKAFNEKFYKNVCKAQLQPVLRTCEQAKNLGIHLELTYLVIPGLNDTEKELQGFCQWVLDKLGADTPVHFSRFHPDYQMMDVPMTPTSTLLSIYELAKKCGLRYPYLGNMPQGDYEHTRCPSCGNLCIYRQGFAVTVMGIHQGTCSKCGKPLPVVTD